MPERGSVRNSVLYSIQNNAAAVAVIVTVLMMFIPLPKAIIDIFMVANLAVAFVIMLTVLYTRSAANFTTFPQLTLLVTLFGLAINISSTRLILTHPVTGSGGAINMSEQSEMVKSFAQIATGNNTLVGFIIFVIIMVVQVVVVTKGASRVSEVQARFSLDSMNSKMLEIQNEVNSGSITDEEGARRKENLRKEISFYSSMDGASKFVSGNVKAGIFITVLNLVGGMITGMVFGSMTAGDALNSYARLTIGDGLMSQVPSLMLSFGTGILVTAGSNDSDDLIGGKIKKEFSVDGVIYVIVGASLCFMAAAFHNQSAFILLPIGALFIYFGFRMQRSRRSEEMERQQAEEAAKANRQTGSSPDDVSPVVELDTLSLDIGYALVYLVEKEKGAELLERVTRIRRESALDLGLVVPKIHIRDSMLIAPDEYSFKIRGIEVGRSRLRLGYYMCLNTGGVDKEHELAGEQTRDPTFGMSAIWIPESKRMEAEKAGYAVIDPPTIIATHLTEIIRRHAADIIDRQEVSKIIEKIKETNPVIVDEVFNGNSKFTYGEVEKVLKNLLSEQVSIRNMVRILETLGDFGTITKDPWVLTEKVRQALGAQICMQYADENKVLRVLRVSQSLAQGILEHRGEDASGRPFLAFDPVDQRAYLEAMSSTIAAMHEQNMLPIVLCPAEIRQMVKSSTEREIPGLVVISIEEAVAAGSDLKLEVMGEIHV